MSRKYYNAEPWQSPGWKNPAVGILSGKLMFLLPKLLTAKLDHPSRLQRLHLTHGSRHGRPSASSGSCPELSARNAVIFQSSEFHTRDRGVPGNTRDLPPIPVGQPYFLHSLRRHCMQKRMFFNPKYYCLHLTAWIIFLTLGKI